MKNEDFKEEIVTMAGKIADSDKLENFMGAVEAFESFRQRIETFSVHK